MNKLARFAPLALVTVVGLPVAEARDYETGRSEYTKCESPAPYRDREHVGKPDAAGVRPDSNGKALVNPSRDGDVLHPGSNVEVRYGKPELRPDAKRDAFTPVDDNGKQRPAIDANIEVKRGKPNLRQEPKRDAFMPTDESGRMRGIDATYDVARGKPATNPLRDKCLIAHCE